MKLHRFAATSGMEWPDVVREWAAQFVLNGTDFVPPTYEKIQLFMPDELIAAVDARCDADEVTFQQVVKHEIAELDKL